MFSSSLEGLVELAEKCKSWRKPRPPSASKRKKKKKKKKEKKKYFFIFL